MRTSDDFAILGSGGHASVVCELVQLLGFQTRCFVDPLSNDDFYLGFPVVSTIEEIRSEGMKLALGIGSNFIREHAYLEAKSLDPSLMFPILIHPSASVWPSASLEEGSVVLAQANIGPGAQVEVGTLLNSGASLDHQSKMGKFSSLGPRAVTGGGVEVGDRSMVGMGAVILQSVSVGSDCVIGASSLVRDDVPANSVAIGTPAKVIRARGNDDSYF